MKPKSGRRPPLRERLYILLLNLYPADIRREDGPAMVELFSDLCEAESRRRGWVGMALISLRSFREVPFSAWAAHRERRRERAAIAKGPRPGRRAVSRPPSTLSGVLGTFLQDLRFGIRGLKKVPVMVAVTVLSLGFGIGAVTTAYSLAAGVIFQKPIGLVHPEGLVTVYTSGDDGGPYGSSSYPDYLDVIQGIEGLENAAAFGTRPFNLEADAGSVPILAEEVSGNYFTVTGMRPILGRAFLPEEVQMGRVERVVILSHHVWIRQFGGSTEVLGRTVRMNGNPFVVVGVGPEGVMSRRVPVKTDAWVPIGLPGPRTNRRVEALAERDARSFLLLGRMRDGTAQEQVQAQLSVLSGRLHQEYAEAWTDQRNQPREFAVVPEAESRLNPRARPLMAGIALFFLVATGLILLIACSNVTTLFLARAAKRRREMAIRVSIGASRVRLVGQLLTEGLILGLAGGAAGVAMTVLAVRQIEAFTLPLNIPFTLAVSVDQRVLLFACLISCGATLLFGLIPALEASRPNLMPSLKGETAVPRPGAKRGTSKRARSRKQLVVIQCAASLVLLVGAALFLRTLQEATTMDLGFNTQGVAAMTKSLPPSEYSREAGTEYFRAMRDRLSRLPGVASAQLSRSLELTLFQAGARATVRGEGAGAVGEADQRVLRNSVTPGYLEMLQIPLLRGRTLQETDDENSSMVAVVNEHFAQRFWPGEDPLGRRFEISEVEGWMGEAEPGELWVTVVGVVRNGTYEDFDDGPLPYFWTSLFQDYTSTVAVSLKGHRGAEEMIPVLWESVELAPGEVSLMTPSTLESQVSIQFIHLRVGSDLLGVGGAFGLILAIMGIYGIVSMAVTERTKEMAIRLALGADRNQVVRRVAGGGTKLALIGLVLGLLVGLPLAHLLRSLFYGVGALDPLALGVGIGTLVLAAFLASVFPATRVTRIDPMTVLREE